jgi:hypothetical protein
MSVYGFEVKLAAAVRVRAADEMIARKVVRSILGSRGTAEIKAARRRFELELEDLANDNDAVKRMDATVTDLTFTIAGSSTLVESTGGGRDRLPAGGLKHEHAGAGRAGPADLSPHRAHHHQVAESR